MSRVVAHPSSVGPLSAAEPAEVELSVLVPVLNEAGSVAELTSRVLAVAASMGRSVELIFVDDGSTDGTSERIRELHRADPRVRLVRLRRNFGKAAALTAGFDRARGRLIVTMDGDLQDDPDEIPRLVAALEEGDYDLISGWKKQRRDPPSKRYPSLLFNAVTRKLAGVELHDFNCGFKIYRREVLEQVSIYGELHRYIPVLASRRGFKVGELDVRHHPRKHGQSKYGWDRFHKGLLDLITVLFLTGYLRRPLHLFGTVGLGLLAGGLAINTYLAVLWFQGEGLGRRPLLLLGVLLMVMGIQVLTTGLLGELMTSHGFRREESYSVKEVLD